MYHLCEKTLDMKIKKRKKKEEESQGHHTNDRLEERGIEKRKRQTIFLQKTREGHRQSNEYWNRLEDNVGETSERRS